MREELGDVLIQIVFHACIAEEGGHFNFDDVAREINEKLIRRHPHVFGAGKLGSSAEVIVQWEAIKAGRKARSGGEGRLQGTSAAAPRPDVC
jgi:XTP/dITP diphosphohydrolase/tetrapyrrole methylase family protein/MazG family protein